RLRRYRSADPDGRNWNARCEAADAAWIEPPAELRGARGVRTAEPPRNEALTGRPVMRRSSAADREVRGAVLFTRCSAATPLSQSGWLRHRHFRLPRHPAPLCATLEPR